MPAHIKNKVRLFFIAFAIAMRDRFQRIRESLVKSRDTVLSSPQLLKTSLIAFAIKIAAAALAMLSPTNRCSRC